MRCPPPHPIPTPVSYISLEAPVDPSIIVRGFLNPPLDFRTRAQRIVLNHWLPYRRRFVRRSWLTIQAVPGRSCIAERDLEV